MTSAELKYLSTVNDLDQGVNGVRLTDIGKKNGSIKGYVYRAMERLEKSGYIKRDENNRIAILERRKNELMIYMKLIEFISKHLEIHCNTPNDIAYNDAIGVVCALSDESRNGIARFLKQACMHHNCNNKDD